MTKRRWLTLVALLAGCGRIELALGGELPDAALTDGSTFDAATLDAAALDAATLDAAALDAATLDAAALDAATLDAATLDAATLDAAALDAAALDASTPAVRGTPLAVFAGAGSTCAILSDGRVACWGRNDVGQLATTPRSTAECELCEPAPVIAPALEGASHIALSDTHGCALIAQRVWCFGGNLFGELGRGSADPAAHPDPIDVGLSAVEQVVVGRSFTCARVTAGEVYCWGLGAVGQLGVSPDTLALCDVPPERLRDLDIEARGSQIPCALQPLQAPSISALELSAGDSHVCVRTAGGGVTCWGGNRFGQIGIGTQSTFEPPRATSLSNTTSIRVAGAFGCALGPAGVQCFGRNRYGELGLGLAPGLTPIATTPIATATALNVRHLVGSADHICVLDATNVPYCAGANENGQLGHASSQVCTVAGIGTPCSTAFTAIVGATALTHIATGSSHTCGVTPNAELVCLGDNRIGQLGVPGAPSGTTPRIAVAP